MSRQKRVVFDATGKLAALPATVDILRRGSKAEIRETIGSIGALIRVGAWNPGPEEREWLGAALEAIGRGERPHAALGLNTKRGSLREVLARESAVRDLHDQGMTMEDARNLVGAYNYRTGKFTNDPHKKAGESLNRAIRRRTK
jgi:hypothetical protein